LPGVRNTLLLVAAAAACTALAGAAAAARVVAKHPQTTRVRIVAIHYRAHDGTSRKAFVVLPAWYGPRNNPPIPLVISPHGRGVSPRANAALWGHLPARGSFAVVSPAGEGRRLPLYSWGSPGQIDDLARMPVIVHLTLPWVHVNQHRIYAFGGSMGGQETLLLVARRPRLLAGAAAFDSVTKFELQYHHFPRIPCTKRCRKTWNGPLGKSLQKLARLEVGGPPIKRRAAYAQRSPFTYARTIAASCVPLQLWWSDKDRIVSDQDRQSGALFTRIRQLNPKAPVTAFVGSWRHSIEMTSKAQLPAALTLFGLLPPEKSLQAAARHVILPPSEVCGRRPLRMTAG
jgi:pimeloyl-ACP methyl ester carboxylesterase